MIGIANQTITTTRSDQPESVPNAVEDTKPETRAFNVSSDEYTRFLTIPKQEPGLDPTSLGIKTEPKPEVEEGLKITDVHTLGTVTEDVNTIIRIDPWNYCPCATNPARCRNTIPTSMCKAY